MDSEQIENLQPIVIDVRNVKKKFTVYYDKSATLKERILFRNRRRHENRWVLRGISFKVRKGEAIGLIGENGCGKSTTLKLLTKILYPDSGTIMMKGRVSSLIELGAGFHPDMSGRENIYTNAAIFGLKRDEIDQRLQSIIDFSELGENIDNPVRTYSSGMYMRLAFSVAINVDADILLIDEILAVGDAAFQAKCFNKMLEIKNKGTTIVIVSHSLSQIEQICERTIWIEEGMINLEGLPRDVHPLYMEYMAKKGYMEKGQELSDKQKKQKGSEDKERNGSGEARMQKIMVINSDGNKQTVFSPYEALKIHIEYVAERELANAVIGLAIYRKDQTLIYGTNTLIDTATPITLHRKGYIDLKIDHLSLANGEYSIDLAFHRPDGFNYDFWRNVCSITISDKLMTSGIISVPHKWELY